MRLAMVACLFACSGPAVVAPNANRVVAPAPIDAAAVADPSPCERYQALRAKADACAALSEEARQDLQQWETDMRASVSESGMDGSTPVDEDRLCEEAADHILEVAKQPCDL